MALDERNNLYVLDRTAVFKYSSHAGRAVIIGHSTYSGTLTVDGAGHASVSSSPDGGFSDGVLIQTFPVNGGNPTSRVLVGEPAGDGAIIAVGYFGSVIEGRDGSLYFELGSGGASGATYIVRVGPGSTTRIPINTAISEYVYSVDRRGNFYLMQNRFWCNHPSRFSPTDPCVDDYAVDSISKWRPAASHPTTRAVNNLMLPVGGIAVDDTGDIYAAVTVSRSATPANNDIKAQFVRISAGHSVPTVLAHGHYAMPTVVNFCVH